jgi:hypothetical protein
MQEYKDGLSEQEKPELFDLNAMWQNNRNPSSNGAVKQELTSWIRTLVQKGDQAHAIPGDP